MNLVKCVPCGLVMKNLVHDFITALLSPVTGCKMYSYSEIFKEHLLFFRDVSEYVFFKEWCAFRHSLNVRWCNQYLLLLTFWMTTFFPPRSLRTKITNLFVYIMCVCAVNCVYCDPFTWVNEDLYSKHSSPDYNWRKTSSFSDTPSFLCVWRFLFKA